MSPRSAIGLTGGIGSGKSTVAAAWVALGATLVDTDAIARALTLPGGAAIAALRDAFGPEAIDASGAMDRTWMRERVFADPHQRRRLESILHPLIGEQAHREAAAALGPVVFDVPLLTETSAWRQRCRRILVVDCTEVEQVRRVVARSGWSESQVRAVMGQQMAREARRAMADAVIHNQGITREQLHAQVAQLHALWFGGMGKGL